MKRHEAAVLEERGSALLLAVILVSVLLAVGAAVAVGSRGSVMASTQRLRSLEAENAARSAVRLLSRNLSSELSSESLRAELLTTFSLGASAAAERIGQALARLPIGFENIQSGPGTLRGSVRWDLETVRSGDPRIYTAHYSLLGTGTAAHSLGSVSIELAGDALLSIGHLPMSHYQVWVPRQLLFSISEYTGPVRVLGDAAFDAPVVFRRDLECTGLTAAGIERCDARARVRMGVAPIEASDSLLEGGMEDITWDKLRLVLRLEPGGDAPPPGVYFDGSRAVFIEGTVLELVAAARGDEQFFTAVHETLGKVHLRIAPAFTTVRVGGGPEETTLGARDRLIVRGDIRSLAGGVVDENGEAVRGPEPPDIEVASFSGPFTIAASGQVTITGDLLAPSGPAGPIAPIGLVSQQIAHSGSPGFVLAAPERQLDVDAHLYTKGGVVRASCERAVVQSIQLSNVIPSPLPQISVVYPDASEGGIGSPPGYPAARTPVCYIGWPMAKHIRFVETTD
ncbi:MAG: hypothetical protein AB1714_24125 [Acidobacteriota bacterium]